MSEIRFPSLEAPDKRAFVYDSSAYHSRPPLDEHMLSYETYGDGMTAHTPPWPIGVPMFCDYLWSLADYLLATPEAAETIRFAFNSRTSDRQIAFAASVRYKAPKHGDAWNAKKTYYSIQEQKIGTSDKLRYDKRYEEVPTWADGSPEAVARLLWCSFYDPLDTYRLNCDVYDWVQRHNSAALSDNERRWMEVPTLDKDADHDQRRAWHDAWCALQSTCRALEGVRWANRAVQGHKEWLERQRQPKPAEEVA